MIHDSVVIINKMGLHARPAALLAKTAAGFQSEIKIAKNGIEVNAKSIMGIMMLAAECGAGIKVTANGPDENEAMDAIKQVLVTDFEEAF